jgi:hypothetical protein
LVEIYGRDVCGFLKVMAAVIAEFGSWSIGDSAIGAREFKFMTTFVAKPGVFAILKLAFWALHFDTPWLWVRIG